MASMTTPDDSDRETPAKYISADFKGEHVFLDLMVIGTKRLLRLNFEPVELNDADFKTVLDLAENDDTLFNVMVES